MPNVYRTDFTDNDRAQAEEDTKGFAKIICIGRKNEIVGAHIVGLACRRTSESWSAKFSDSSHGACGGLDPVNIFNRCTQNLSDAPGLGDATARRMRRVCVENLRDLSQAGFVKVFAEVIEPVFSHFATNLLAKSLHIGGYI